MAVVTYKSIEEVDDDFRKFKSRCPLCSKGDMTIAVDNLGVSLTKKYRFTCTGKCAPVVIEVTLEETASCENKMQFAELVSNKYHLASKSKSLAQQRREEAEW